MQRVQVEPDRKDWGRLVDMYQESKAVSILKRTQMRVFSDKLDLERKHEISTKPS